MPSRALSTFAGLGAGVLGLGLYVFGFIFLSGSSPGKNKGQDDFIDKTCTGEKGLVKTVLTWGYAKATWRRFINRYKLVIFPQPQAMLGKAAPDAKLATLDGKEQFLLRDHVEKMAPGMPLILNMGSFT